MRLTVLGSSASYAGAGRACSGYLVSGGAVTFMLECGNGSLANAARHVDVTALDAVVVSHAHPDHTADLFGLQAALRYAPDGPAGVLALHAPEGLLERMGRLLSERGARELAAAFAEHPLRAGVPFRVGEVTLTACPMEHDGATFGFTVDADGARLFYTADTALTDEVLAAAAGADVLLCECTLPPEYRGRVPHLAPDEVARLARASGAHTVVLTHLWPAADRDALAAAVRAAWDGDVRVADEGDVYEIAAPGTGAARPGEGAR